MTAWNVREVVEAMRGRAQNSGLAVIDLGQGTPTDPTPDLIRNALAAEADAPGYPPAHGTPELRAAYAAWVGRRFGAALDVQDVIATVGSKELIATLPWLLGLGPSDCVVVPELAYPTYRAGAQASGCRVIAADSLFSLGPQAVTMVWVNTPGNPTGRVLPTEHLAKIVAWARERDALVVSDECYIELTAIGEVAASVLSRDVAGDNFDNILAVHSLSKRSSMAGYRCGFVSGDSAVIQQLLTRRRDMGLVVPGPVQAAGVAALNDDLHVIQAQERYARRRRLLADALSTAGFDVEYSEAGLFLWASRGESDGITAQWFADRGILVAPGGFYGPSGAAYVRLSLTAPDAELTEVVTRLGGGPQGGSD